MRHFRRSSSRSNFGQHRSFGNNRRQFSRNNNRRSRASFDPSLLVQKAEPVQPQAVYHPQHQFGDFELHPSLTANVLERGYTAPTPIQDQAIPEVMNDRDLVGIANTGTGKTAAFLLPLIHKVLTNRTSRVLIVVPTRELAVQVQDEFRLFTRGLGLFSTICIGGAAMLRQIENLRRRPHFVIGTPGRLKDLEQRRKFEFSHFDTFVLDEVDRMLDMGFVHDVKYMIDRLPQDKQSLFFSATMTDRVKGLMQGFLKNPVFVKVATVQTSKNIDQDIVRTQGKPKVDVLHDLLIQDGFSKVLVFGRTKHGMEKLARELHGRGFKVAAIHGNKSQGQRMRALKEFKSSSIQVLLATDVVSRGVDIDNVTHVINYDLPETYEDYVHRIGRTGRADKTGVALTLVD
ncbi:MAG TPA: DEAD/DEAH box helicase [Patescibacteria group bacterium]